MSGRRGDSDFTLQEGGNGTLPPPMPTYGYNTFFLARFTGPDIAYIYPDLSTALLGQFRQELLVQAARTARVFG